MSIPTVEKTRKKTGGRKAGVPNKRTTEFKAALAAAGITPLEYMLKVMRDTKVDPKRRDAAAAAAAPYMHAKLASVEHSGKGGGAIITDSTIQIVLVKPGETSAA